VTAVDDLGAWQGELLATALVGTDRRRPARPPSELGVGVLDGDERDPRTLLLDQAALQDVLLRAGRRPQRGAAVAAAPPETRPTAPPAAAELLGLLLTQPPVPADLRSRLLRLWLDSAARHGMIVPPRRLPALLELARTDEALAVALHAAWGERGAWLAGLVDAPRRATRPELSAAELAEQWPTLPTAAAADALRLLRRSDPAAARDLLASAWGGLPARGKQAFLAVFDDRLSADDEPFLEAALDDGSAPVRQRAGVLLGHLPDSRYARRMAERLLPLIAVNRRLLSKRTVAVSAPTELDEAGLRDGFPAPAAGVEPDRVAWLRMLVENAPLSTWTAATGVGIPQTLELILPDKALRAPLIEAVHRQRDAAWATAFLEHAGYIDLVELAEPAALERWLVAALADRKTGIGALEKALSHAPEPWSPALTSAVLDRMEGDASPGDGPAPAVLDLTAALATALPESSHPRVRQLLTLDGPARARRSLAAALQYHAIAHSIRKALP